MDSVINNAPHYLVQSLRDEGVDIISYCRGDIMRRVTSFEFLVYYLFLALFAINFLIGSQFSPLAKPTQIYLIQFLTWYDFFPFLLHMANISLLISIVLLIFILARFIQLLINQKVWFAVTNKGLHIAKSPQHILFYPWSTFSKEVRLVKSLFSEGDIILKKDSTPDHTMDDFLTQELLSKAKNGITVDTKKVTTIETISPSGNKRTITKTFTTDADNVDMNKIINDMKLDEGAQQVITFPTKYSFAFGTLDNNIFVNLQNVYFAQLVYNHIESNISRIK
jgi:hypothetical protein